MLDDQQGQRIPLSIALASRQEPSLSMRLWRASGQVSPAAGKTAGNHVHASPSSAFFSRQISWTKGSVTP